MARNPFAPLLADLCHARNLEWVLDPPEDEISGEWWVEIIHRVSGEPARCTEVCYSYPKYGFGLYSGAQEAYGEKPEKTTYSSREAADWVMKQLGLEQRPAYPTEDSLSPEEREAVDPLMPLIRLLAGNVHASVTPYADPHFALRILDGLHDEQPEVLGLRDGFYVALENGWDFQKIGPDLDYRSNFKAGGGSVE